MIQKSSDSKFIDTDERNNPYMTLKTLKFYCQKQSMPSQPQLNQTLYLQYKGFQRIIPQTISLYINLKTLHLNNNGIVKIQGLHMLRELTMLHLNNNFIQKIQGLEELNKLSLLNLAHNKLDFVEGLDHLSNLRTLNLSENFFTKTKDIQGLISLVNLNQLNLSKNQLHATQEVFQIFSQLDNLSILYLKETPLSTSLKNYRKRMILQLKKLKFLDNRPVLPRDHQLAEAWNQGGVEKEKQLKTKLICQDRQSETILTQKVIIQKEIQEKQNIVNSIQKIDNKFVKVQNKYDEKSIQPKKMTKLNQQSTLIVENANIVKEKKQIFINQVIMDNQSIYEKVEEVLGDRKTLQEQEQQHQRIKRSITKKWNHKYIKILQQLLMKYKFDFSQVQPSINMIVSNINKKLMKPSVRFQISELRYIWTQVEKEKRKEQLVNREKQKKQLIQKQQTIQI